MSDKPLKAENPVSIDQKNGASKHQEQRGEHQKGRWASVFNCSENEGPKACKKVKFKWIC